MAPNINIHDNQVDPTSPTAARFLSDVLAMDLSGAVLTDISELSDFRFSGEWVPPLGATYPELSAHWDRWVLGQVYDHYGIILKSTYVNLLTLWNQIEQKSAVRVH